MVNIPICCPGIFNFCINYKLQPVTSQFTGHSPIECGGVVVVIVAVAFEFVSYLTVILGEIVLRNILCFTSEREYTFLVCLYFY